jgi:hypothetical protein
MSSFAGNCGFWALRRANVYESTASASVDFHGGLEELAPTNAPVSGDNPVKANFLNDPPRRGKYILRIARRTSNSRTFSLICFRTPQQAADGDVFRLPLGVPIPVLAMFWLRVNLAILIIVHNHRP